MQHQKDRNRPIYLRTIVEVSFAESTTKAPTHQWLPL